MNYRALAIGAAMCAVGGTLAWTCGDTRDATSALESSSPTAEKAKQEARSGQLTLQSVPSQPTNGETVAQRTQDTDEQPQAVIPSKTPDSMTERVSALREFIKTQERDPAWAPGREAALVAIAQEHSVTVQSAVCARTLCRVVLDSSDEETVRALAMNTMSIGHHHDDGTTELLIAREGYTLPNRDGEVSERSTPSITRPGMTEKAQRLRDALEAKRAAQGK